MAVSHAKTPKIPACKTLSKWGILIFQPLLDIEGTRHVSPQNMNAAQSRAMMAVIRLGLTKGIEATAKLLQLA
jgi:uncharacterized protein (DUF486 family)